MTPSPPSPLFPLSFAVSHFWSFISLPLPLWLISSLPPLLYSINLSIRHVDYIRDYRLKGIPFHLSLSLLALHLPLSLYCSSALTHPSSSVRLTHVFIHTYAPVSHAFLFFPGVTWSHIPPLSSTSTSTSTLLISLRLFGHVLSCHSSFSSVCLPPPHLPHLLPRLFPASLSFTSFSDILPARCVSFAFPQHDNHWNNDVESESWLSRMTNLL